MTDFITMAHGNGGATMQELIRDYFVEAFDNPILSQGEDQARIALQELDALGGILSFSTDSFVIDPIFSLVATLVNSLYVVPLTMSRYAVPYQNICLVALFWKKAYHWKL